MCIHLAEHINLASAWSSSPGLVLSSNAHLWRFRAGKSVNTVVWHGCVWNSFTNLFECWLFENAFQKRWCFVQVANECAFLKCNFNNLGSLLNYTWKWWMYHELTFSEGGVATPNCFRPGAQKGVKLLRVPSSSSFPMIFKLDYFENIWSDMHSKLWLQVRIAIF